MNIYDAYAKEALSLKNYKIRIKDLEEEIKKLKEENGFLRGELSKVVGENLKLKSDLSLVIKERDDNIKVNEFFKKTNSELGNLIEGLKEQNIKLKSDLAFKNTMLDNVRAEYGSLKNVIKKMKEERDMHRDAAKDCGYDIKELKERIRFLEQCLDNKEKVNISLREENKRLSDFLECES